MLVWPLAIASMLRRRAERTMALATAGLPTKISLASAGRSTITDFPTPICRWRTAPIAALGAAGPSTASAPAAGEDVQSAAARLPARRPAHKDVRGLLR